MAVGVRRGWLFVAPLLIVNLLVILGPAVASVYYSLTDWSGLGDAKFVGLDNYRRMVGDAEFHQALLHNVIWMAIMLTVPLAMGLLGAFLLSQITRFRLLFRVAYFIPYMMASVVNAALWQNILDPNRGVFSKLGILEGTSFFGNEHLALYAVAFVDNWHWWGFALVLFLTAMQSVPRELYEAAILDGAGRWAQFRNVTLPGIRPTLTFVVLMTVIWSFMVFDYIYIITQGGPGGATEVISTLMYKEAFSRFEAGYAAALGLSMSALSGVAIALFMWLRRREPVL